MVDLVPTIKSQRTTGDKIASYVFILSQWFKRKGRDVNGNPIYEAPLHAVVKELDKLKRGVDTMQFFADNGFCFTEGHGIQLQSYSLKTDLKQIIENYLEY